MSEMKPTHLMPAPYFIAIARPLLHQDAKLLLYYFCSDPGCRRHSGDGMSVRSGWAIGVKELGGVWLGVDLCLGNSAPIETQAQISAANRATLVCARGPPCHCSVITGVIYSLPFLHALVGPWG